MKKNNGSILALILRLKYSDLDRLSFASLIFFLMISYLILFPSQVNHYRSLKRFWARHPRGLTSLIKRSRPGLRYGMSILSYNWYLPISPDNSKMIPDKIQNKPIARIISASLNKPSKYIHQNIIAMNPNTKSIVLRRTRLIVTGFLRIFDFSESEIDIPPLA